MNTTYLTDAAELAAQYPDARPPKNGLPWQSEKLGVDLLVSDQNGCIFLIARHNPLDKKPARLVRTFFSDDGAQAPVAVIECVSEAERQALIAPIQSTIGVFEEESNRAAAWPRPADPVDLDAPAPRTEPTARLGDVFRERYDALRDAAGKAASQRPSKTPTNSEDVWRSHSLQSFYFADAARFNDWFLVVQAPKNSLPNRSTDRSTFVFTAFDDFACYAMLVREDLEQSSRNRFVREAFNAAPDAYAWVVRFEDWMMRDTFALDLQCRLFGSLIDRSGPDDPPVSGDDPGGGTGPRGGDDDPGVPAVTNRPDPTRSGSAANELPEEDEPEIFYIGPEELAETPVGGELAPAHATLKILPHA